MSTSPMPTKGVLIRDLLILQLKLLIDAVKDVLLIKLAFLAVVFDILFGRPGRSLLFYSVLRLGERFDLWLNLYGAARSAEGTDDGLFGASLAGSDSLLGKLEQFVRREVEGHRSASGAR
ncbi:MAG TPA: hypothetical protein VF167_16580 [Longimicrobiaceae bacterium]